MCGHLANTSSKLESELYWTRRRTSFRYKFVWDILTAGPGQLPARGGHSADALWIQFGADDDDVDADVMLMMLMIAGPYTGGTSGLSVQTMPEVCRVYMGTAMGTEMGTCTAAGTPPWTLGR